MKPKIACNCVKPGLHHDDLSAEPEKAQNNVKTHNKHVSHIEMRWNTLLRPANANFCGVMRDIISSLKTVDIVDIMH